MPLHIEVNMVIKTDVFIDGVKLPNCVEGGIVVTRNKLYGKNAGRSETTGDFIGDIITRKYDVNLTWGLLREADFEIIQTPADSDTVEHEVKMMFDGKNYETRTCYIADLPRTIKKQRQDGVLLYQNVTLHIVEV